jgi:xanthine phosphoribosyltransferase
MLARSLRSQRSDNGTMESLKNRIRHEGKNLGDGILKIDSVINHQVDAALMLEAGSEFAKQFADMHPSRVLTAEVSGIIPAMATAYAMGLPLVYARKHKPVTMMDPVFVEFAPSHTKGGEVSLMVSPEFIDPRDRVLIIDDFLATGQTIAAMARIVQDAGATLVGIGTLVEKSFEGGREKLAELGVPIFSLVTIEEMRDDGTIIIAE